MLKDEEVVVEESTTLNQPAENTSRKVFHFSNTRYPRRGGLTKSKQSKRIQWDTQQSKVLTWQWYSSKVRIARPDRDPICCWTVLRVELGFVFHLSRETLRFVFPSIARSIKSKTTKSTISKHATGRADRLFAILIFTYRAHIPSPPTSNLKSCFYYARIWQKQRRS